VLVDGVRRLGVGLGAVHVRVRGAVDHRVRVSQRLAHGGRVRHVELGMREAGGARAGGAHHVLAQHASGSDDVDRHGAGL
jgi:hypothetical protein